MSSVERVVKDYKTTLSGLQRNDKLKINALTMLAEDYAKFSPHIVKLLEDSVFEAPNVAMKMVRLYLIDSILKNVSGKGNYVENFSDNLIKVFLHVFQVSDEKNRGSLYKLRNTWNELFPRGKLYLLDVEVHGVDPKWPIPSPQKNGTTLPLPMQQPPHNPAVKPEPTIKPTPNPPNGNKSLNGQKIFVNPNFGKEPPAKKARTDTPPMETPAKPMEKLAIAPEKPVKTEPIQKKPFISQRTAHRPQKRPTPPIEGRNSPRQVHAPVLQPTDALGSHAFNIVPPTSAIPPPNVTASIPIPNAHPASSPNITSIMSTTIKEQDYPMPTITTQAPTFANPPINMSALPPINTAVPPPAMLYPQPPQIRNEAPRLPNLPSNNRIFVDGKAYQVFYLDNVAVIERNGVPHKISFSGPPRDVVIDGKAYRMAFGETKPVVIDGQTHYLKFGAPSRELYMGDFAFKGAFGGPPIAATINGRRHEIRLSGPPPEVKIEQDPCYELMRHMQNLRQNIPSESPQLVKEDKDLKISDFLAKLQKTGVLDTLSTAIGGPTNKTTPNAAPSSFYPRGVTPPILSSNVNSDKFEVRDRPASLLSQFNMADLKRRYASVIGSIHQYRSTCPECGLFFDDLNSAKFKAHTDQHIQTDLNSSSSVHPMGDSRQRYLSEEEWVSHSKIDDLNRSQPSLDEEESSSDEGETDGEDDLD